MAEIASENEAAYERTPLPVTSAGGYSWYVLGVLVVVYILNFIDRQILSILAVDIKTDLGRRLCRLLCAVRHSARAPGR